MTMMEQVHSVIAAVDHALVLWMQKVDVVELAEVVDHSFPVAVEFAGLVFNHGHAIKLIGRKVVGDGAEEFLQGLR